MKGSRIPQEVYETLPSVLFQLMEKYEDSSTKDAILLSIITSLGAVFYNISGDYNKETLHPNLLTFIIGPPGVGKGEVKIGPELISGINKKVKGSYSIPAFENSIQTRTNDQISNELKEIMLPGNSSYAAIMDHLIENNGIGFMFESEADTVSKIIGKEWGDFSDFLRKIYHHERVSIRRKGKKPVFIEKPKVSLLLTGTTNQITGMVDSVHNGLFSRFCFYYFETEPEWQNANPRFHIGKNEEVNKVSEMVTDLWEKINLLNPSFYLKEYQWDYHTKVFEDLTKYVSENGLNNEFHGSVRRMGSVAFRISMILELCEYLGKPDEILSTISCSSRNLENAIRISNCLFNNSLQVAGYLENSGNKIRSRNPAKRLFYDHLPEEPFKRKTAVNMGNEHGLSERSIDYYLSELVSNGELIQLKAGFYSKNST